ncbi:MAG TPA: aldehyde dehydrogenase family protein [Acidimicrobiales bacterium]|nr:aldehyde dehydrogenase family protein [Acidimicrobiales bacterium]
MTITSRGAVAPTADQTQGAGGATAASAPSEAATAPVDTDALDAVVTLVADHAPGWAKTDATARAKLLQDVIDATMAAQDDWLAAAVAAKGLEPGSTEAGEELLSGVGTFVRMARLFRDSLRDIAKDGRPSFAGPVREAVDGRLRVQVFPATAFDRITFAQTTAEVWMQPGVTRESLVAGQAPAYTDPVAHVGTALVLAAGNVASLGPRDVLSKLFVEGKVVVMKANPVNDYLVPHWSRALAPLIDAGVLRIVDGGAAVGQYLTAHPRIDEVHITGSDKTYDAVVFGTGDEGARRKAADEPLLDKPVTAELGNVSPIVVVPGKWTIPELRYQAEHIATMLVNNAGFNCISARVVITHDAWPQRDAFIGALTQTLAGIRTRRAYYPGAVARRDAFVAAHPEAESLGSGPADALPWTFIADVPPGRTDDIAFNVESFFGELAETALPAPDGAGFLDAATAFCNDVVWGTLGATIIVAPSSLKDPGVAEALERSVADLRYGSIGVNAWHGLSFAMGSTTWGAYPGHPRTDIQSGTGVVGNALMFDRPQKSVVRAPFRSRPKPPWFATAPSGYDAMRRFVAFEAEPSAAKIPGLMLSAMRH